MQVDLIISQEDDNDGMFYGDRFRSEKLCDQILIIDHGHVIAQGTPAKLIEKHFEEDTIEFENPSFIKEEIGILAFLDSVTGQKLNVNSRTEAAFYAIKRFD